MQPSAAQAHPDTSHQTRNDMSTFVERKRGKRNPKTHQWRQLRQIKLAIAQQVLHQISNVHYPLHVRRVELVVTSENCVVAETFQNRPDPPAPV
jgi:ribulose bisphosphate carboxylase small subunit